MKSKRRKYTRGFKGEPVRLARESGKPTAQVARDPGIHRETLATFLQLAVHRA